MPGTIAIGPQQKNPSWNWIGIDTAAELRKYFDVLIYGRDRIPAADVVIIVKQIPPIERLEALKHFGCRVVYLPIDFFRDEAHIETHRGFLSQCDHILVHSESLSTVFREFAPTRFLDHHGKFFLPEIPPYKEKGHILWIGGMQNLPYLLHYLNYNPLDIDIKILTDFNNQHAYQKAIHTAQDSQVKMQLENNTANGWPMYLWTPERQATMLYEAKAALDIKGDGFNQRHKPPAKAQQFICSGIPLAMNQCDASAYFSRRGLCVPMPSDYRWLSRQYYDEVRSFASRFRPHLTLESIGSEFRDIIDDILNKQQCSISFDYRRQQITDRCEIERAPRRRIRHLPP
jgi:hypothetical protein